MLLSLPATLCLLALVIHSLYFRPLRATLLIFAFAVPVSMLYGGPNFYIFHVQTPRIPFMFLFDSYPVPVMNMVGFLFTFYTTLSLAIHIYEDRDDLGRRVAPLFKIVSATVYFSAFIGLAIEYSNLAAKWWSWTIDESTSGPTTFFRWFGVWAWRPLLFFPWLLNFFVVRDKGRLKIFLYCIGWIGFFLLYMVSVDKIFVEILRPLTLVVWLFLPLIAGRKKTPVLSLRHLQYRSAQPLLPRLQRWTLTKLGGVAYDPRSHAMR